PQDRETAAFTWHGALVWLVQLASELKDLDAGIVSPTLTPAGGSKALPTPEWMDRMTLVCLIEQLHAMGMKYEAAARRAIVDAKVHGMKVLGTAEDALSWRAEFQKGRVKNERAVWFYNQIMEYLRKTRARDGGMEKIEARYKQTLGWVEIPRGQIPKKKGFAPPPFPKGHVQIRRHSKPSGVMQDQVIHNDAPLVTIDAAVELVREKTGVPITKSRIHKDSAAGIAPPPDAVYGRRYLWRPEKILAYAQTLIK